MAHSHDFRLKWGQRSRARWTENPTGTALVFVHGYGGSPLATFTDFDLLLPRMKNAAGCDLLFYGYPSRSKRVGGLAADFLTFLTALASSPSDEVINPASQTGWRRKSGFRYRRIVLIAHSLGAVIVRRALLRAVSTKASWLPSVEMVFYAPAHLGAAAIRLAGDSFLGGFMPVAQVFRLSLNDLDNRKGGLIEQLQNDTMKAIAEGSAANHLVARRVIHAHKDWVVDVDVRFGQDPECDFVEDWRDHRTICKPRKEDDKPFALLREIL